MKKIIIPIAILVLVAGICLITYTIKNKQNKDSELPDNPPIVFEPMDLSDFINTNVDGNPSILPHATELKLDVIYQKPELPTGCEPVALTMLLNYYDFNLDKTTIADEYLIYSDANYITGFKGDPSTYSGGGCYAPALTNSANRFLISSGSNLVAQNISGTELEDLFVYISKGNPVIVWSTIGLADCSKTSTVYYYGDTAYNWVSNEHCVVLGGYNLIDNTVTVYDSISGKVTYDIESFKKIYDEMWQMAIVLTER